jgi:hypothetical protein
MRTRAASKRKADVIDGTEGNFVCQQDLSRKDRHRNSNPAVAAPSRYRAAEQEASDAELESDEDSEGSEPSGTESDSEDDASGEDSDDAATDGDDDDLGPVPAAAAHLSR